MSDRGVPCMWMRGGSSKGGYFLASDLPHDRQHRNAFLLAAMGSPDPRQIDGMGGADPLTSKVAVVSPSEREGADVDYLFLQVVVDRPIVSDSQNCGNILAGVGGFAIERGLVPAKEGSTEVTVFMVNTGQYATLTVNTPERQVSYAGEATISGVPGSAAPVPIAFRDTAGSSCGALLPTGRAVDLINGVDCTLIDNGMPCVVMRASALGIEGTESPEELEGRQELRERIEAIRLAAGPMMNLGDVGEKSVPKMTLVSPPREGGAVSTRTFIPHRCHKAIGVLGAVTVATACLLPEGAAAEAASVPEGERKSMPVEHPTGQATVIASMQDGEVAQASILRTARKLFDGKVYA